MELNVKIDRSLFKVLRTAVTILNMITFFLVLKNLNFAQQKNRSYVSFDASYMKWKKKGFVQFPVHNPSRYFEKFWILD